MSGYYLFPFGKQPDQSNGPVWRTKHPSPSSPAAGESPAAVVPGSGALPRPPADAVRKKEEEGGRRTPPERKETWVTDFPPRLIST